MLVFLKKINSKAAIFRFNRLFSIMKIWNDRMTYKSMKEIL